MSMPASKKMNGLKLLVKVLQVIILFNFLLNYISFIDSTLLCIAKDQILVMIYEYLYNLI